MLRLVTLEAGGALGPIIASAITATSLIILRCVEAYISARQEAERRAAEERLKMQSERVEFQTDALIEILELLQQCQQVVGTLISPSSASPESGGEIGLGTVRPVTRIQILLQRLESETVRACLSNYLRELASIVPKLAVSFRTGSDAFLRDVQDDPEMDREIREVRELYLTASGAVGEYLRELRYGREEKRQTGLHRTRS